MAISRARPFNTGSAPGSPKQTGQTLVLGGAPKPVAHPQKILLRVLSWTCTSNPITGSYFAISSGEAIAGALDDMLHCSIRLLFLARQSSRAEHASEPHGFHRAGRNNHHRTSLLDGFVEHVHGAQM